MSDRFRHKVFKTTKALPSMPDEEIAKRYINKIKNCVERDIPFSLSLQSYINLCRAKKCYYTGFPLHVNNITIDRIDSTKGYEKGNVVACHKEFNQFKSFIEDPQHILTYKSAFKGISKLVKRLEI